MSKEKILKEFDDGFGIYWSNYKNTLFRCNPNDILDKPSVITSESIKQFLSQAIDQTREETIREVEEMIGDFNWYSAPQDLLVTFGLDKEGTRHKLRAENLKQSLNKLKK